MAKRTTRSREDEMAEADESQEESGPRNDALTTAVLVITTLCLVIAIAVSWWQLGRDYKAGLFGG